MIQNINNNLTEFLSKFINKRVVIIQDGFLRSKYFIYNLHYFIKYDILNIIDTERKSYLKINLNQIYKIKKSKKAIKFFLDNDTIIYITI